MNAKKIITLAPTAAIYHMGYGFKPLCDGIKAFMKLTPGVNTFEYFASSKTNVTNQPCWLSGLRCQQCSNTVGSKGPRFKSRTKRFNKLI